MPRAMPPSGRPTVAVMMPDGPCMPSTVHRSCLFSCLRYLSSPLPHLTAVNQLPPPASLSLFRSPSYLPPTPRNPFILTPLPPPRPCETFLWRRSFWSVGRRAGVVKQNGFLSRPGELAIGMNAGSIAVLNATTTTAWTDRQRSLTDSQSVRAHIQGGFKAESLLGHITRKASSPLPSSPSPPLSPLPFSLPSTPLEVRPLNPARGLGERCKLPQRRNRI